MARPARPASVPPDYSLELARQHTGPVIGIDEAGRGPWAGPVTAAAFWVRPGQPLPDGLADSKKLTGPVRTRLAAQLQSSPHLFSIAEASAAEIDQLGILAATFTAMDRAVCQLLARLPAPPGCLLVDGNLVPGLPGLTEQMIAQKSALPQIIPVIRGDGKSLSIAAASILAKTDRDRRMAAIDREMPGYGFASHKGYGTRAHAAALDRLGPSGQHRRSFRPVARLLAAQPADRPS